MLSRTENNVRDTFTDLVMKPEERVVHRQLVALEPFQQVAKHLSHEFWLNFEIYSHLY